MKALSLKESLVLAGIVCSLSPVARAQLVPIQSFESLRLLPGLIEANPIRESHAMASPKGKVVYAKAALVFSGALGALLKELRFNSMTVTLGARHYAPGSSTGRAWPVPRVFQGTNQEFTLLSVVPDSLSVLSLGRGFSARALTEGLIEWSRGSELLLIDGGEAWRIMAQLPAPKPIEREGAGGELHEVWLAYRGQVVCARETFSRAGSETSTAACLLPMGVGAAGRAPFSFPFGQDGGQQQQQYWQQQQQQRQQMQGPQSGVPMQQQQRQQQERQQMQQQPQTQHQRQQQERQQMQQERQQQQQQRQQMQPSAPSAPASGA